MLNPQMMASCIKPSCLCSRLNISKSTLLSRHLHPLPNGEEKGVYDILLNASFVGAGAACASHSSKMTVPCEWYRP